jgi:ionotropic kainate glutamate receptor 2
MTEKGIIQSLYNKWWKSSSLNGCSADKKDAAKASALGVDSIGKQTRIVFENVINL